MGRQRKRAPHIQTEQTSPGSPEKYPGKASLGTFCFSSLEKVCHSEGSACLQVIEHP